MTTGNSQPNASLQYADWKRWPKTYREPTHEEWLAEISRLSAENVSLHEQVAALESREVCTVAHEDVETCGYCQRDRLRAAMERIAAASPPDDAGALVDIWYQVDGSTIRRVSRPCVPRVGEKVFMGRSCYLVEHIEWREDEESPVGVLIDLIELG